MDARRSMQTAWRRYFRTITIPAPVAGVDPSAVVPAGEIWQIESIYGQLVSSVTVANRAPRLVIGDGDAIWLDIPNANAQAAGATVRWAWTENGYAISQNAGRLMPIPALTIEPGATLAIITDNLDVADQWGVVYVRALVTVFKRGGYNLVAESPLPVLVVNPPPEA